MPEPRRPGRRARRPYAAAHPGRRSERTVLYEFRTLLAPASHRLAGTESVSRDDIADDPLVACAGMSAVRSGFWRLEPRPERSPAPLGSLPADTVEDRLEVVADGRAVAIVPAYDRRCTLRDDLATVPVGGVEPCQAVVVSRADDRSPLVACFRGSPSRFPGAGEQPRGAG